jgi:hypothetical protein
MTTAAPPAPETAVLDSTALGQPVLSTLIVSVEPAAALTGKIAQAPWLKSVLRFAVWPPTACFPSGQACGEQQIARRQRTRSAKRCVMDHREVRAGVS